MSRVSRRGVIAGPKVAGQTYAGFQAHIATLATNGVRSGTGSVGMGGNAWRTLVTNATIFTGFGSSWNATAGGDANAALRHAMPSQAEWDAQVAAGREVFWRTIASATNSPGTTRNGLTTANLTQAEVDVGYGRAQLSEVIYWDGTQAQRMTPNTGGGPTPYSF